MTNKRKIISAAVSVFVGLIFVLSGFLKSLNASDFANIIANYGVDELGYLAPVIILYETILGLLLILGCRRRFLLKVALVTIITLTAVYTYGLVFNNVEQCGCFGNATFISDTPVVLYVRNAMLAIACGLGIWITPQESSVGFTKLDFSVFCLAIVAVAFSCGSSFHPMRPDPEPYRPIPISQSPLNALASPVSGNTRILFLFSYSCPHCLNSIANLNEYAAHGVADNITAYAVGHDDRSQWFEENFNPRFNLVELKSASAITKTLPRLYYVRNDTIVFEYSGELPCWYLFEKILPK